MVSVKANDLRNVFMVRVGVYCLDFPGFIGSCPAAVVARGRIGLFASGVPSQARQRKPLKMKGDLRIGRGGNRRDNSRIAKSRGCPGEFSRAKAGERSVALGTAVVLAR